MFQVTREILKTLPSRHLASMETDGRRDINLDSVPTWSMNISGKLKHELNANWLTWVPWSLDQTGIYELEEP